MTQELTPVAGSLYPHPADEEVRTVDEDTGGEKGLKITRYDLIPHEFEDAIARHYGVGAKKYQDRNWERGYRWGYSLRAARTHLNQWQGGERYDGETGSHHLICAIWHLIALFIYDTRKLGKDDITRLCHER